jgi:hypothetical protein
MRAVITTPKEGQTIPLGPVRMRIREDGSTTKHRLGIGEIMACCATEPATEYADQAPDA